MTTRGNAEYPCAVDSCPLQAHERRICGVCTRNLERDLAEMPALLDDLSVTLSRQARIGGHTNGSRAAEQPLPYDPRASEAGDILRSTLVGWVRELHDGVEHWPMDSLHAMALWLFVRMQRLFDHPVAEEAVDEIGAAVRLCKRVTDRPMPKVYAGRCLVDDCEGELYAKPMAAEVDCQVCGIRHDVGERRQVMREQVDQMLFPLSEIARLSNYFDGFNSRRASKLLGIWEARRRIQPSLTLPDGQRLYPFGEMLGLLLATPTRRLQAV